MTKRSVEVFVAGCPACDEVVAFVGQTACPSCDVSVGDMRDPATADAARALGVRSVPAVAVNGRLLDCCKGGVDVAELKRAGIGTP